MCCCMGSILLSACDNGATTNQAEQETVVAEDTSLAGPRKEAGADTILQVINHVTLRAIGNSLQDIAYDQDTIQVKAGALVKLKLVNEGAEQSMFHNVIFTYPDKYRLVATEGAKIGSSGNYTPLDSALVIAASPLAKPGQTVELDFEAPLKPGEYAYVCSYPNHYQRMHGILIVK
jgi:azurin